MAVVGRRLVETARPHRFTVRSPRLLLRDCVYQLLELLDPISGDTEVDAAEAQLVIGLEGGSVRPGPGQELDVRGFGLASYFRDRPLCGRRQAVGGRAL